jgi:hypothetical protein
MLLNLFLAILLKALSKEPPADEEEEALLAEDDPEGDEAVAEAPLDASNNAAPEPSAALDSSNSNIEAEFEVIKRELEKISRGLHLNQEGAVNLDHSADNAVNPEPSADLSGTMSSQSLSSEGNPGKSKKKGGRADKANKGKMEKQTAQVQAAFATD